MNKDAGALEVTGQLVLFTRHRQMGAHIMNWSAATRLMSMIVLIPSSFAAVPDVPEAGVAGAEVPRSSFDPGGSLKPGIGLVCCSTLTLLISIGSATFRNGKLTSRNSATRRQCSRRRRPPGATNYSRLQRGAPLTLRRKRIWRCEPGPIPPRSTDRSVHASFRSPCAYSDRQKRQTKNS